MKKLLALALSLVMVFGLVACGGETATETEAPAKAEAQAPVENVTEAPAATVEPITLTVNITAQNVEDNFTGRALQVLKDKVEEVSGGQIILDCYWGNTLYAQDAETPAVIAGDLFMTFSSASYLTDGSPWLSMFNAGYFFEDVAHMNAVLNGEIGQQVFQRVAEEQGILPLAAFYTGARSISLSQDKEVSSRADLEGVNLRMPGSESFMFMGKALGANPTAIAFGDLYLALQTGAVEGQDNPVSGMIAGSFYEVQKSISLTGHVIDSVWPSVNLAQWNALTEEQRGWIMEGVEAARVWIETITVESDEDLIKFCEDQGLTVYRIDTAPFAAEVNEYYLNSDVVADWDMELYEACQNVER